MKSLIHPFHDSYLGCLVVADGASSTLYNELPGVAMRFIFRTVCAVFYQMFINNVYSNDSNLSKDNTSAVLYQGVYA